MLQLILNHDSQGFTLIEVMVAIVIMLVGALGLLQALNVAMNQNIQNQRREEVVRVAEGVMHDMRSQPFGTVFNPTTTVPSKLRSSNITYAVARRVTNVTTNVTDRYQVDVKWVYRNYSARHTIVTIRGN